MYLLRNIDGEDVVTSVVWWFVGLRQERKDPSDFYQIGSRWCFQTCFVFTPLGKDGFGFGKKHWFFVCSKLAELGVYFNMATGDHYLGSNQENLIFWLECHFVCSHMVDAKYKVYRSSQTLNTNCECS